MAVHRTRRHTEVARLAESPRRRGTESSNVRLQRRTLDLTYVDQTDSTVRPTARPRLRFQWRRSHCGDLGWSVSLAWRPGVRTCRTVWNAGSTSAVSYLAHGQDPATVALPCELRSRDLPARSSFNPSISTEEDVADFGAAVRAPI